MWIGWKRTVASAVSLSFVLGSSLPTLAFDGDSQATVYFRISFGGGIGTSPRQAIGFALTPVADRASDAAVSGRRNLWSPERAPRFDLRFDGGLAADSITVNGGRIVPDAALRLDDEGESTILGMRWRTVATVLAIAGGAAVLGIALSETLGD